jgi:biotin transport system substrate-specific component
MKFRPLNFFIVVVLVAFIAPFSVSLEFFEISITAQTLVLFAAAMFLYPLEAVLLVVCYLFLGAIGIPVFSGHSSGMIKLTGTSAGFLWAFVPSVFFLSDKMHRKDLSFIQAFKYFLFAHLFVLLVGGLWMLNSVEISKTIKMLVFTFIPISILKSALLALLHRVVLLVKKS